MTVPPQRGRRRTRTAKHALCTVCGHAWRRHYRGELLLRCDVELCRCRLLVSDYVEQVGTAPGDPVPCVHRCGRDAHPGDIRCRRCRFFAPTDRTSWPVEPPAATRPPPRDTRDPDDD